MSTLALAGKREVRWRLEDAGLTELRAEALRLLLVVLLGVALLGLLATGVFIARVGVAPAELAFGLAALSAADYHLVPRSVPLAAALLVAGLVVLVAAGAATFPAAGLGVLLFLPVLVAVVLVGTVPGLVTLLLGAALVGRLAIEAGAAMPDALARTLGPGALTLVVAWVLWRSFYTVLDWSWSSYAEAQRHAAELRERQAELGRLNHSLVLAYEQIKQTSAQLERARHAAEEARRQKAEFAASVSHELRTPLNLIIGLSELMVVPPHDGAPRLPPVYQADAEAIYRNACHISNLIDDVLDLSQMEAHRLGLLREWTSLRPVVEQAAATVRTLFENTGLGLKLDVPADLPRVFVDPVRIRQILINLLNNAVRFTETGGVAVAARLDGAQIVVDVADTGVGISPEDLAGVFQEFWRSGEPRRGRRGSGLGLAVSKRFAELHGGNMWVTSTLGQGSVFSLALPLGEKSVVHEPDLDRLHWERLAREAPAQPAVVLVDPEPETSRVFRRYLDGYRVAAVRGAGAAARLATEREVSAIVVDSPARRPAVLAALRPAAESGRLPNLPIITCDLRTAATIARDLEVRDYLVKPVTQAQLRRTLRRLGPAARDLVVADDDPEMLHLLGRIIGALGPDYRVRTATDGREALDLIQAEPPRGIFLDLLMPGLDGYGVLARLKADPRLAAIPVVVISARGTEDDGLVASTLEISQPGGLRVAEVCRWLKGGLARPEREPARPAGPDGSPACSRIR